MTKANLFHHFKSKEELGLAVLDYKTESYKCGCLDPMQNSPDPIRAVSRAFSDTARFMRSNGCKAGCFVGNIALEMSDINERFRERAGRFFEQWTACLENKLRTARADGYFASTLKPRAAAEAVLALFEGAIMLARTRRDPEFLSRMGREACRMLEAHKNGRSVVPSKVEA